MSNVIDQKQASVYHKESGRTGDLLIVFGSSGTVTSNLPARSGAGTWAHREGEASWTCLEQPPSPLWKGYPLTYHQHGAWQIWLLGELYGDTAGSLAADRWERQWVRGGGLDSANGHFLVVAWNDQARQWHLWTNRFGTMHAYHSASNGRAAIGTYFPSVAAAASRRQLDWIGLTGFFGFGFFPEDRTYFDDVRVIRPASHVTLDERGQIISQERYWQWWHEPDRRRSYDATVEDFKNLFHQVLAEHSKHGRIAIPISGGLDSRSTVAALTRPDSAPHDRERFWAYSYGYSNNSVETRIARSIAKARHLAFDSFTIPPYLFSQLEQLLARIEGFQDVTLARQAAVTDPLAARADYVIAAHWGDVWLDDMGVTDSSASTLSNEEGILAHAQHKLEKGGRQWLLDHICRPRIKATNEYDILRACVEPPIHNLRHIEDPDFRVKAFKTDQWSFRWTLTSIRMFQAAAFPRLPFYDTRIADFFCTVPTEFVRNRRLQIDYLKRSAPDLARIIWQPYDANLFHYHHFNTWHLPKRAIKKLFRRLQNTQPIERNWEVQFLHPEGRRYLEGWLVRPRLKIHEFVAPMEIQQLLDAFFARPFEGKRGYTVSMLLTFSAWLELNG